MASFMTINSIHSHIQPSQKNTKNDANGIYVSYAVVIGIHRIILFDPLNNVQGFIFNGSVLSVDEAGPELSAYILEPLRVADPSDSQPSVSPPSSVVSGTTFSTDTDHLYNDMETNEPSPDPPPSLLLSAPEYVPRSKRSANSDSESKSSSVTRIKTTTKNAIIQQEEQKEQMEQMEQKEYKTEEVTTPHAKTNKNIVSIVGNRVVLIQSIDSIETQLSPITNAVDCSYNFRRKKCIRNSGLKRSRTTFETKKRRRVEVINKRRSKSCGILTVVRE